MLLIKVSLKIAFLLSLFSFYVEANRGEEVRYNTCYSLFWYDNGWWAPRWKHYSPVGRNWLHFDKGAHVYLQKGAVKIQHKDGGHSGEIVPNNADVKVQLWDLEVTNQFGNIFCVAEPWNFDYWGEDDSVHRGSNSQFDYHTLEKTKVGSYYTYSIKFRSKHICRVGSNDKSTYSSTKYNYFRFINVKSEACGIGLYDCLPGIPPPPLLNQQEEEESLNYF